MKKKIMFVHPEMSTMRQMVEQIHNMNWHCVYVTSADDAIRRIANIAPDIVFLEMGYAFEANIKLLEMLRDNHAYHDTLVIVSIDDVCLDQFSQWNDYGIDEILLKPWSAKKLNLRITKMLQHQVKERTLMSHILQKMKSIEDLKDAVIMALGSINEYRDNETSGHAHRTQYFVQEIALELRKQGHYKDLLTDTYIELLYKSAPLHDIGKIGIPEAILMKKETLSIDEFELIKTHASIGERIIASIIASIGSTEFLQVAMEIAGSHHEKWDGSGYPRGLSQEVIPLSARLMGVADAYDALTSNRAYRTSMTHAQAMKIIVAGKGSFFDPIIVDAFMNIADKLMQYSQKEPD